MSLKLFTSTTTTTLHNIVNTTTTNNNNNNNTTINNNNNSNKATPKMVVFLNQINILKDSFVTKETRSESSRSHQINKDKQCPFGNNLPSPVCLSAWLLLRLSGYVSVCLVTCMFVCVFVRLSVCVSVCMYVCLCASLGPLEIILPNSNNFGKCFITWLL